ncbi:MAG: ABC transporter substrate-binding protein [Eubacteriaceae bacterium]|nr:ABC transporter substrate-binding protein [Eubacteriaceae bacterium]
MKRLVAIGLVFAMALTALAGCGGGGGGGQTSGGGGGGETDVIKIGVFQPLTGAYSAGGTIEVQGVDLAKKYCEEKFGKLLGKEVELVIVDNKSDTVEAATAAAKLVEDDKVDIVLGSWGSGLCMAGGDSFKNSKTIAIGASCTNPNVTIGNDYYYRICFLDPFQGTVLANYAYNTLGATKVAAIYEATNDYAVGLYNFFKEAFETLGGEIVETQMYQTEDQDFNSQILTVMAKEPEIIFAPGVESAAAIMMRQTREAGYNDVIFMGGDTWETPMLIDLGGEFVEGCIVTTFFDPAAPLNDITAEFVELYTAEYGTPPAAFTALGFDSYLTAFQAITEAGSTDSDAIMAVLENIVVKGVTGDIAFNEIGDAIKNMAVLKTVQNGEFVFMDTVTIE